MKLDQSAVAGKGSMVRPWPSCFASRSRCSTSPNESTGRSTTASTTVHAAEVLMAGRR